ncbi:MAG TPA: MFS transporter [Tepidisphaeraceae bacterium]|nr:MFS transporter [Tepidisphaeraceae bacterium]
MSERPQQISSSRPSKLSAFYGLWTANVLSTTGGYINDVGAAWLMTSLSTSPLLISLIQVVSNAPFFLLALPAGALGDILDKRKLLLVTQIAMMLLSALLGALTMLGLITPLTLLLVLFATEVFDALAGPAWQTVTPEIVGPKNLRFAITLSTVGINVARAVGPALGGALVAITSTSGPAFLVDSASFIGVIAFLWRWRRRTEQSVLPAERFIGAMRVGFRFVRYAPRFRATLVRIGAYVLFSSALATLLPVIVRSQLHRGPSSYGVLLGFMGAGAVTAVPVLQATRRVMKVDVLLPIATAMSAVVQLALAEVRAFPILCGVMVIAGVASVTVMSSANNAAQSALPAWVRARAMSAYLMVFFGAMTIGGIVWGILATRFGPPLAMTVSACGMLATLLLIPRFHLAELELDVTPSFYWPAPIGTHELSGDGGPVLVTVEYRVDPQHVDPFVKAMQRLRLQRMRTGAFQWGLYNDTSDPERFVEVFLSESWAEHLRQHGRLTVSDREFEDAVARCLVGHEKPVVRHLIYADTGAAIK